MSIHGQGTLRAIQHDWNNPAEHCYGQETNFLVLADFAKFSDANSEVSEGAVADNRHKVVFVQSSDNLECRTRNTLC